MSMPARNTCPDTWHVFLVEWLTRAAPPGWHAALGVGPQGNANEPDGVKKPSWQKQTLLSPSIFQSRPEPSRGLPGTTFVKGDEQHRGQLT